MNEYASGLWTGVIFVGCGVTGVLAYSRWYVKKQIAVFLFASIFALAASVACIAITSVGLHVQLLRLHGTIDM